MGRDSFITPARLFLNNPSIKTPDPLLSRASRQNIDKLTSRAPSMFWKQSTQVNYVNIKSLKYLRMPFWCNSCLSSRSAMNVATLGGINGMSEV
jgi:hypothetical protein